MGGSKHHLQFSNQTRPVITMKKLMDSKVFEDRFFNTMIPVFPPNTNIIMDNASYHSRVADKVPSSNSNTATTISWLNNSGVCFAPDLRKPVVYFITL